MKNFGLVALTAGLLTGFANCKSDSYEKLYPVTTTTCDTSGTISYSRDIAPIIASNCYNPGNGCHDAAGSSTSLFNYESYSGVIVNVTDGALLNDINWTPLRGDNNMPKNGNKLAGCDINKITKWINEGYPNN